MNRRTQRRGNIGFYQRELIMIVKKEGAQAQRKAWSSPELKRIAAGSAETGGTSVSPDSGPIGGDVRS
jgi:hypothetical protein